MKALGDIWPSIIQVNDDDDVDDDGGYEDNIQ
jgi:hypothetical protein